MARLRAALLPLVTLAVAVAGALLFIALHLPLAPILGALVGAAVVANVWRPMRRGKEMRRFSQLFVGGSIGAYVGPETVAVLLPLLPMMLGVAVVSNLLGAVVALPVARVGGIDRLTALLSCLPAGMAEMATLARELDADEQSVAIIHTLRVVLVLTVIPLWLVATGHRPPSVPAAAAPPTTADLAVLGAFLAASLLIALAAHRARIINAFIIAPMLLCIALATVGQRIPPVPSPVLVAAQIGIGASLGLRFRVDRLRALPRTALGGLVSGLVLIAVSFGLLGPAVEWIDDLDHLSAILATAPGGLGEMIASAGALGVLAASVAGFQLMRSLFTNMVAAPIIRARIRARGAASKSHQ